MKVKRFKMWVGSLMSVVGATLFGYYSYAARVHYGATEGVPLELNEVQLAAFFGGIALVVLGIILRRSVFHQNVETIQDLEKRLVKAEAEAEFAERVMSRWAPDLSEAEKPEPPKDRILTDASL